MKLPFVSKKKYEKLVREQDDLIGAIKNNAVGMIVMTKDNPLTNVTLINPIIIGKNISIMNCTLRGTITHVDKDGE